MDNTTAHNLVVNRGTILCLDVPEGTQFGVDLHSWTVGPKFKGVKMIPPGFHYVHYGSQGTAGAGTMSFFMHLEPRQVVVRKWNKATEDLYLEAQMDPDEISRFEEGVRRFDFDAGLGAYPDQEYEKWLSLTSFVTENVISKLSPITQVISSAAGAYADDERAILKQLNKAKKALDEAENPPDSQLNPNNGFNSVDDVIPTTKESKLIDATKDEVAYKLLQNYCPRFTHIPRKITSKGASAAEITKYNLDKSAILNQILSENYPADALHSQMKMMPDDFFVDALSSDNFLKTVLKGFFEVIEGDEVEYRLREKAAQFKKLVEIKFATSFSVDTFDMNDEDAPTVMDE